MKELHNEVLVMLVSFRNSNSSAGITVLATLIQVNRVGISKSLAKNIKRLKNKMVKWQLCWYI